MLGRNEPLCCCHLGYRIIFTPSNILHCHWITLKTTHGSFFPQVSLGTLQEPIRDLEILNNFMCGDHGACERGYGSYRSVFPTRVIPCLAGTSSSMTRLVIWRNILHVVHAISQTCRVKNICLKLRPELYYPKNGGMLNVNSAVDRVE